MEVLDRDKILAWMVKRKASLWNEIMRDFGGGLSGKIYQHDELKYWKEAIERGEFDTTVEETTESIERVKTMNELECWRESITRVGHNTIGGTKDE